MKPKTFTVAPTHCPGAMAQSKPGRSAFTLTELAAIMAGATMLAVAGLPASALRTKAAAQQTVCLNNKLQMTRAWLMYAQDNATQVATTDEWVDGTLSYNVNYPDNTNVNYLMNGQLGPYLKGPGAYKCPADRSMAKVPSATLPRVRSISMSAAIGTGAGYITSAWLTYGKTTQITNPTPANLWVFIDENPDSINDGTFAISMDDNRDAAAFIDGPSVLHNKGCTLGFADGHAEAHTWTDPRTIGINQTTYSGFSYAPSMSPNNSDIAWLEFHTSAMNNGTPGW